MKTPKINLALFGLGALLLISMLALTAPIADAQLKQTNVVYAWEEKSPQRFQNSNVVVYWNGDWVPFLSQVDDEFNTTVFVSATLGINTRYAGTMDYGLYHTDNNPAGVMGFQATRRWSLVWCDRTGDGSFDGADLSAANPTQYYTTNFIETLPTIFVDQTVACSTGNCQDEIVTRLLVNMDKDNDGNIDAAYRVGGVIGGAVRPVCFYAEAQKPLLISGGGAIWNGPLQARITAGGGDKTVTFNANYANPTAVTLTSFGGDANESADLVLPMAMVGLLGAIAGVGVWKFRTMRKR